MHKRVIILLSLMLSPLAIAKNPAKLGLCISCHQKNGISQQPIYPNLAGQKKAYLLSSMKAYKNGSRKHANMKQMMMPLSDKDMEELATYFSSLK